MRPRRCCGACARTSPARHSLRSARPSTTPLRPGSRRRAVALGGGGTSSSAAAPAHDGGCDRAGPVARRPVGAGRDRRRPGRLPAAADHAGPAAGGDGGATPAALADVGRGDAQRGDRRRCQPAGVEIPARRRTTAWPAPRHVELDGRAAHPAAERELDDVRDNEVMLRRERTLRYGWRSVIGSPCLVARQVGDLLAQGGWPGRPTACRPLCRVLESSDAIRVVS